MPAALGFTRRRSCFSPRNIFLWFSIAGVSVTWQILKSSTGNICGTLTSDQQQKEGWPGQPGFYAKLSGWVYPAMTEEVTFGALLRLIAHHSPFHRREDGQGSTPALDKPSSVVRNPLTLGLAPQMPYVQGKGGLGEMLYNLERTRTAAGAAGTLPAAPWVLFDHCARGNRR